MSAVLLPLIHNLFQLFYFRDVFDVGMAFLRIVVKDAESLHQETVDIGIAFILHLLLQLLHHHVELLVIVGQIADILFDSHAEEVRQVDLHGIVHAEVEVEGGGTDHALDEAVNSGDAEAGVIV